MSLQIGIVGLPNVGKSTLFNALTKNQVLAANYPFATIEPNVGVVELPDSRLETLAKIYDTNKIIYSTVEFVDIAGIVKGASKGEGLGNKFLANIREADAICMVTRAFEDSDVTHVDDEPNPKNDIETITTELIFADLQTIENAMPRLEKERRGNKIDPSVLSAVSKAKDLLESGHTLYEASLKGEIDLESVKNLQLLTSKPFIYVFNVSSDDLQDEDKKRTLASLVSPTKPIFLDAKIESELAELDKEDAAEMLSELAINESGLDQLARVGFDILGLQTFLTAGEKEVRAWTIHKGWKAPKAAGVIHTDFEKGFIKAEVISYDDLVSLGSVQTARAEGKARIEGKDYVMQPSDVVEFRFSK